MLPDTHRFQQAHPHSLSADDGLVAVDTGTDGIPHAPGFRVPDCRMKPPRLRQPCKQHGIADGLRQGRYHRSGNQPHGNGFRLPVPRDRLVPRLLSGICTATSRRVLGGKLVGFLQQGHLLLVSHLRGLLYGGCLLQLLHLGFQRLLSGSSSGSW